MLDDARPVEPPPFAFDRAKLALSYDVPRLQQEVLEAIGRFPPYLHYSVVPLIAAGPPKPGVTDYSDPDWTVWVETPLLKEYAYVGEVLESLRCRKTSVRLLRLAPGGELQEHCDPQLDLGLRKQVRLHVPVFTDESAEFLLNGTPVPLRPGELWYLRLSDPHAVRNPGPVERIHLSIDVVVNGWVQDVIVEGADPQ